MRFALVNPPWSFDGSIYFGCRDPHLPLEFGYAKAILEEAGHEVLMIDGQIEGLGLARSAQSRALQTGLYSSYHCAVIPVLALCAPGASSTTTDDRGVRRSRNTGGHRTTQLDDAARRLNKLKADVVVCGEAEEILPLLTQPWELFHPSAIALVRRNGCDGRTARFRYAELPALEWPDHYVDAHAHHHHRFDAPPMGPGAEVEASRGCPYHCTFCAKDNFREQIQTQTS